MARQAHVEREYCVEHGQCAHFLGALFDEQGFIAGEALHCSLCHPDHPENPWPHVSAVDMRSLRVLRGTLLQGKLHPSSDTVFVPLPRELWRAIELGCTCDYCTTHPSIRPYWDTLAISTKAPKDGADATWLVHMPEAHRRDR